MKSTVMVCCLMGMLLLAIGPSTMRAADPNIVTPLQAQYEATSALVLGMAQAIPEDKYDFKPTPEVRSFREQLQHLIAENNNYIGLVLGEDLGDQQRFTKITSRADLMNALSASYDRGKKAIAALTDQTATDVVSIPANAPVGIRGQQKQKWAIVMAVLLDNMDHYGNLVVYARVNGIVPPRTAARQQPAR